MASFLPEIDGLWLLWSIKESAFKSAVKWGWDIRFSGRDFLVKDLLPHQHGCDSYVTVDGREVPVRSEVRNSYLHSYVRRENQSVTKEMLTFDSTDYQVQSRLVKKKAIQRLAKQLGLMLEQVTIAKDSQEVPFFHYQEERLDIDLTISHHGRFGAYLFT